jgi:hypothetical protein
MAGVRSAVWHPGMLLLTRGLPGRPVELVDHHDRTNPSTVPGIDAFLAKCQPGAQAGSCSLSTSA